MEDARIRLALKKNVDNRSDADQGGKAVRDLAVTVLCSPFQVPLQELARELFVADSAH